MNTKPTFIIRTTDKTNQPSTVDAIKIIEYYLSLHPSNRVIPDSPLYRAAIKQYNTNIKNTTVRPDVPAWFCGKVNPDTNELIAPPTDEVLRASAGFVVEPAVDTEPVTLSPITGYAIDNCLQRGTPGSYDYAQCVIKNGSSVEDDFAVSGINWLASLTASEAAAEEAFIEETTGETKDDTKIGDIWYANTMTEYAMHDPYVMTSVAFQIAMQKQRAALNKQYANASAEEQKALRESINKLKTPTISQ